MMILRCPHFSIGLLGFAANNYAGDYYIRCSIIILDA